VPGEKPRHRQTDDKPEHDEQNAEFERFEDFVKKIAAVPKEEVDERRREYERERQAERAKRKRAG
jgi:hypothetical protein